MEKDLKNMYPLIIGAQEPVLRAVAKPITTINKEIRTLAKHMLELMWLYDGV